jgi:hypothetical protein
MAHIDSTEILIVWIPVELVVDIGVIDNPITASISNTKGEIAHVHL